MAGAPTDPTEIATSETGLIRHLEGSQPEAESRDAPPVVGVYAGHAMAPAGANLLAIGTKNGIA